MPSAMGEASTSKGAGMPRTMGVIVFVLAKLHLYVVWCG